VIGAAPLPGFGMPQDRLARIAARQAFVDLKQDFTVAVALLPGERGEWLRRLVRRAEDPATLWCARRVLFSELRGDDPDSRTPRRTLQTGLDSIFADSLPATQPPR